MSRSEIMADQESSQESTPSSRPNRRAFLTGLTAAFGAAAVGTLGGMKNTEAKPKEPELTPEQKEVAWAQEVLKKFGMETREDQIAFCQRWLKLQVDNASIYLPANIGRFYKGAIGQQGKVIKKEEYWTVRVNASDATEKRLGLQSADPYDYRTFYQLPNPAKRIGHESNVGVMQIELARFCLKYEEPLKNGNLETITAATPTIPGFYLINEENIPSREALKALSEAEIFKAFGLSHAGSRRLFAEAVFEGLKRMPGDNGNQIEEVEAKKKFTALLTGTAQQWNTYGCIPLDDELARFLVMNRDALLEEPIDLDKLRTPLL